MAPSTSHMCSMFTLAVRRLQCLHQVHNCDRKLVTWCFINRQISRGLRIARNKPNRRGRVKTTTDENQYERLADSVTPYHNRSYEKQLQTKEFFLRESLRTAANIIHYNRPSGQYTHGIQKQVEENEGLICPFKGIKPAPDIFFYRNKDQLSVGTDVYGETRAVGLFVGKSSHGRPVCVSPKYLTNIKTKHKEIARVYQDFLRQSARGEYTTTWCMGYWSSIVMRSNQQGDTMLTVMYRTLQKHHDEYQEVKEEVENYFRHGPGRDLELASLYIRPCFQSHWHNCKAYLVLGKKHIYEEVLGRKFRISPDSFFQTNTPAAEVLYSTIRDIVTVSSARSVVDVCCGTGIIGILTSDLVEQVFGMDIVDQAVADAKVNAEMNGVTNTEYLCGKAHRVLRDVLPGRDLPGPAVAIVNPGRDGVNVKVVNALRTCTAIEHVVYVSCKPHGNALVNFVDLTVPADERLQGSPFMPVQGVGVDMFPHTSHSELVMWFKRS